MIENRQRGEKRWQRMRWRCQACVSMCVCLVQMHFQAEDVCLFITHMVYVFTTVGEYTF